MLLRLAIAVTGAFVGVPTFELARRHGGFSFTLGQSGGLALLVVAGASLIVASMVAVGAPRRRWVLVLPLLLALAWFAMEWGNPGAPSLVFTTGLVVAVAVPAVVLNLAVERTRLAGGWPGRVLMAAGYVVFLGFEGLWPATLYDPRAQGCPVCPRNIVLVTSDPSAWAEAVAWGVRLGTVLLCGAVVVLGWWLMAATAARRRDAGPIVLACLASLGVSLIYHARSLDAGFLGTGAPDRRLWQWQAVTLTGVAAAVIADAVRSQRAQRAMTAVVHGLGPSSSDVRETMAARLGDADLTVVYDADDGCQLDGSGRIVPPDNAVRRSATAVERDGTRLATVLHRPDIPAERVRELASAVNLALDHERLQARALAQLADIRQSGQRIIATGDAERRSLERDLHDGAQQYLVTALLELRLARRSAKELTDVERLIESSVERLRDVAHGLYPVLLERAGLEVALRSLAETRPLRLEAIPSQSIPTSAESTAYLIVEQASRMAPSSIHIVCDSDKVDIQLRVAGRVPDLNAIADRVTTMDGTLLVHTMSASTIVIATVPI